MGRLVKAIEGMSAEDTLRLDAARAYNRESQQRRRALLKAKEPAVKSKPGPKPKRASGEDLVVEAGAEKASRDEQRKKYLTDWEAYCLEQVRIVDKSGKEMPFVWNRPQRRLAALIVDMLVRGVPVRIVVLKARQWGCSTLIGSLFVWMSDTRDNYRVYVLTLDDDSTDNLREMYDQMFESVSPAVRHAKSSSARKYGEVLDNGSGWRIRTAGTKATAGKVGRSKTMQGMHVTEESFWEAGRKTLLGALNTVDFVPGTVIVRESTANGSVGSFYDAYQAAKNGNSQYTSFFVPWWEIDWYQEKLTHQEKIWWDRWRREGNDEARRKLGFAPDDDDRIGRFDLTPEQYKWWSNKLINGCEGDVEQMRQEFPDDDQTCFMRSGGPVFREETLKWLLPYLSEPARYTLQRAPDGGIMASALHSAPFMIWEMPQPGFDYLMTADSCMGPSSRDYTVCYVFKRIHGTLDMVAKLRGKYEPNETGEMMLMLYLFYAGPLTAPEMNPAGGGTTILEFLRKNRVSRIYRRLTYDVAARAWVRDQLGWYTSSTTRPMMIAAGQLYLKPNPMTGVGRCIIRDRVCHGEALTFVKSEKTDKIAAAPGKSDDAIMAAMMGCRVDQDYAEVISTDAPEAREMAPVGAVAGTFRVQTGTGTFGIDSDTGNGARLKSANPAQEWLLASGMYD